jgi:hypothetical protein
MLTMNVHFDVTEEGMSMEIVIFFDEMFKIMENKTCMQHNK